MKVGIVGLPNVGKSTLFNLLSKSKQAESGDYPFCTIDPNVTKVEKYDHRLETIGKINNSAKIIYSEVEIVDIAGIIEKASEGAGLGNKFLSNIRSVHSIIHVVRDFEGAVHVYETNNCQRDYDIINQELLIADLQMLKNKKTKNSKDQEKIDYLIENIENLVNLPNKEDYPYDLLSFKPQIVLINSPNNNAKINNVKPLYLDVGELECTVNDFGEETASIKEKVSQLISEAHKSLGRITYFTVGPKEARAWSIKIGSNAREAASKIHTDLAKKFVKAEIYPWDKPEEKQLVGPEYIVQDGDVILFRSSK